MDEDEDLFRPPWEEDDGPRPSGRRAARGRRRHRPCGPGWLFEAADFLAHQGPAVHPHDLALRDANLTGSYTLAVLTGRLRQAAPRSTAAGGEGVADALARKGGGEFALGISAASPRRHDAGHANLPDCSKRRAGSRRCRRSARSRLHAAGAVALREPLVTGRLLARQLGVSARAGLDLATKLVRAGVLREMTGRASWRGFAV